MQVFRINNDGTTDQVQSEGNIKDILKDDECYVLIADDVRKVYLWKGQKSSVRKKFIGAKRSQDFRGQVGMHYVVVPQDQGEEEQEFIDLVGGPTTNGIAKEIKAEDLGGGGGGHPLRDKPVFSPPSPASGMNIAGSRDRAQNTGPLYTGANSMAQYTSDQSQVNFEQIMQKLEEIKIPEGYERELIIIGSYAYSVVEKVQSFLGKKQSEKVIEKVGSIPEGIFFAEDYSPRILSENGKIVAIEFLKQKDSGSPKTPAKKKNVLQDQIKKQLESKS